MRSRNWRQNCGYRSKLEAEFQQDFPDLLYEHESLAYVKSHTYKPDFWIADNCYLELKGIFTPSDRTKMLEVMKQNPQVKIAMVFQRPQQKLNRSSRTSYADWCDKHDIEWFNVKDTGAIEAWIERVRGEQAPASREMN